MSVELDPAREAAREALETALGGYFAAHRLEARSLAFLYSAGVPTVLLWIHSWHPLPGLVTWCAALAWMFCEVQAVALALGAVKRRAAANAALPNARRVARLHFATGRPFPAASALLLTLATLASSLLLIQGLAPQLLRPDVIEMDGKLWPVFFVGALGNRWLELL
jgi:hypothetical protein